MTVQLGDTLGSYRLVELLGTGGMGEVYRAEHQHLSRQAAIKLLKPELVQRADAARRFLEEARAVNELGHPRIVQIIDFVEQSDRTPPLVYMVMELLRGHDLAHHLDSKGPLACEEAVEIGCQIAEALTAVHERKILHRDLKIENIFLLATEDDSVSVKLLDFGAAKMLESEEELNLTAPGMAVGTPAYMAPEVVFERELDQRADIYAFGVVLYRMLTCTLPYEAKTFRELMQRVIRTEPRSIPMMRGSYAPPVPVALQQIALRCLRKYPEERYQTMEQVRLALLECLSKGAEIGEHDRAPDPPRDGTGEPREQAVLPPAPPLETSLVPIPRLRLVVIAVSIALVLAAVGVIALVRGSASDATRTAVTKPTAPIVSIPKAAVTPANATANLDATGAAVKTGDGASAPEAAPAQTARRSPTSRAQAKPPRAKRRPRLRDRSTASTRPSPRAAKNKGKRTPKAKSKRPANLETVDPFAD